MPTPLPLFASRALSVRLEAAEVAQILSLAPVHTARLPEREAAVLSRGGGCAGFFGRGVAISRAVGLGMSGPVEAEDIDAIEGFYRARSAPARLLVSPYAHPSLLERLGKRGFRLLELDTMLVRPIDPREAFAASGAEAAVRVAGPDDAAAWVQASLEGFSGQGAAPPREAAESFEAVFHAPSAAYFFTERGGGVMGTGALDIQRDLQADPQREPRGGSAHFFATSTAAAHRGCGIQGALIDARLAFAQAAGCDLAFARTEAGSASQRNLERRGFRPVYSRAFMEKRFD